MDQDYEGLVPPFLSNPNQTEASNPAISPSYVRALLGLISACHSILDSVIIVEDRVLRSCPTVTFVKTLHALKVLAILNKALNHPNHVIGRVIDVDSLKIDAYSQSLCRKLEAAASKMKCRVPSMILLVVQKIAAQAQNADNHGSGSSDIHEVERSPMLSAEITREELSFDDAGASPPLGMLREPTMPVDFAPSVAPSFDTGALDVQTFPDFTVLSDFEEMVMPDLYLGDENYSGFLGWERQTFDGL